MNMQTQILLLLCPSNEEVIPSGFSYWVDDAGDNIIDDSGDFLIFNG